MNLHTYFILFYFILNKPVLGEDPKKKKKKTPASLPKTDVVSNRAKH